ncbi:cell filamentation protein Fic [Actinomycetota bacterium]|nr:cell filamentation protein Fic [Actinomycetota bacterium]
MTGTDIDFDKYLIQGEPDSKHRAENWAAAIGLQMVDGLKTSAYLRELAVRNIEGDITIDEVKHLLDEYYNSKTTRDSEDDSNMEADKVSANITKILAEDAFSFIPLELVNLHRLIFEGIFDFAGRIRDINIRKREWVLASDSVIYAHKDMIMPTLEYDFREEKQYKYYEHTEDEQIAHIAEFISSIWRVHPFGEGNTRTTAVFLIKYLHSFGFRADIVLYRDNSWFFRNALVRASYENANQNILPTTKFVENFIRVMSLGADIKLTNREMHINWPNIEVLDGVKDKINDENVTVNVLDNDLETAEVLDNVLENVLEKFDLTKTELSVFKFIVTNPKATYEDIALKIGKTPKTAQRTLARLKKSGNIHRVGSDKNGHWEVIG